MLKLAFYYNHYNTLGHSTRVFSLVKGLKEYFGKKAEIIVLQGGKDQPLIPLSRYSRVYLLPYSIDKRGLFIEENIKIYENMISSGKLDGMLKKRILFTKSILNEFKPNIFITEYFPFGQEFWTFELPHILRYIKSKFNCKIIGSAGYLSYINNIYNYIQEFYDALFIHSPKEFIYDYRKYLHKKWSDELDKIFKDFSAKIFFTGFVISENSSLAIVEDIRRRYLTKKFKKLILVSRGGGIVNKRIILSSIMAAKLQEDIFFIITCGPATSEREFTEYKKLSKNVSNLKLAKAIAPDLFDSYLKAADLNISMSGYNTTVRLLYLGSKVILVPYGTSEQGWRADLVSKYLPCRVIPEKDLNVSLLRKNIAELLNQDVTEKSINKGWFEGVNQTNRLIGCMI